MNSPFYYVKNSILRKFSNYKRYIIYLKPEYMNMSVKYSYMYIHFYEVSTNEWCLNKSKYFVWYQKRYIFI